MKHDVRGLKNRTIKKRVARLYRARNAMRKATRGSHLRWCFTAAVALALETFVEDHLRQARHLIAPGVSDEEWRNPPLETTAPSPRLFLSSLDALVAGYRERGMSVPDGRHVLCVAPVLDAVPIVVNQVAGPTGRKACAHGASELHPCPFADMDGDNPTPCSCCEECTSLCADDV